VTFAVPFVMGVAAALLGVVVLKCFRAWRFHRAITKIWRDFDRAQRGIYTDDLD
jgi:hypothetical protein